MRLCKIGKIVDNIVSNPRWKVAIIWGLAIGCFDIFVYEVIHIFFVGLFITLFQLFLFILFNLRSSMRSNVRHSLLFPHALFMSTSQNFLPICYPNYSIVILAAPAYWGIFSRSISHNLTIICRSITFVPV